MEENTGEQTGVKGTARSGPCLLSAAILQRILDEAMQGEVQTTEGKRKEPGRPDVVHVGLGRLGQVEG